MQWGAISAVLRSGTPAERHFFSLFLATEVPYEAGRQQPEELCASRLSRKPYPCDAAFFKADAAVMAVGYDERDEG